MADKSTRRDFLKGRAADAGVEHGKAPLDASGSKGASPSDYLVQFGRRAMATQFQVVLNAGQYPQGTEAALDALDEVERLEEQLSAFRITSELSRINREAFSQPVSVEAGLFALLEQCVELWRKTEGAFDITAAPLWRAWGFARRQGAMPSNGEIAQALEKTGSSSLALDAATRSVRFLKPGMEINLGSVGKGYALDRAGTQLRAAGIGDFLLHGGLSSVLATGGRRPLGGGSGTIWTVGLSHPLRPAHRLAEIDLAERGLGTSGAGNQFFRYRGRRYGHILDPRTGWPADGVLSATAVLPSAALSDALATAFYVMGWEKTLAYCRANADTAAVVVTPTGRGNGFEMHSFGIDAALLRRMDSWSRLE